MVDSAADIREPQREEGDVDAAAAAVDRDDVSALRLELQGMKIMALHKRALSMGVGAEMADEAMDADDAKAAVIGLMVWLSRPWRMPWTHLIRRLV